MRCQNRFAVSWGSWQLLSGGSGTDDIKLAISDCSRFARTSSGQRSSLFLLISNAVSIYSTSIFTEFQELLGMFSSL